MNERLNKEELLGLIKSLKISKDEFWILSSGALTLRGLYPDAGDLDIAVTKKGFEELKKNYNIKHKKGNWYIVNELVECVCDKEFDELEYKPDLVEGYYVQNIYEYYNYLKNSEREKDKKRIPLVEKYISTMND